MLYFLIFKNPYKYIIPVKEPVLKYTKETTWLLDESNKETHFSTAYNLKFKEKLQDPSNAFPYFLKAFDDNQYDISTRAILEEFKPLGEVTTNIPNDKDDSIDKMFQEIWLKKKTLQQLYLENSKEDERLKVFELADKINIPDHCKNFEMPQFIENKDNKMISAKSMLYTFYIGLYANDDEEKTKKAMQHCRLLANQSNPVQLFCSVQVYQYITKYSNLPRNVIAKIESELPDWPNFLELYTRLYRSEIIYNSLYQFKEIDKRAQEIDKDLYLDKNIYLNFVNECCTDLKALNINAPLNKLTMAEEASFIRFVMNYSKDLDKRTLAEIILFSGNSADRHRRFSRRIGSNSTKIYLGILLYSINMLHKTEVLPKEKK